MRAIICSIFLISVKVATINKNKNVKDISMRDFTKQSQTTMDNVDASVSAFDRGGFFNPHRAKADTVETRYYSH